MKVKEWGDFDVTEDRSHYIGGSDIPVIMGISPFKRSWDLLLEKAGLEERSFRGNKFTEYGHTIEPQIRDYINRMHLRQFIPNRVVDGDFRYHSDGCDNLGTLEVKSTSTIHASVDDYKMYLVQLVKGMEMNESLDGYLAVYDRPEDMNPVFDPERLQYFHIYLDDYLPLLKEVNDAIDSFRKDLARLKENPLLTEQDFLPASNSLVKIASDVVRFESQLAMMKDIEQKCKEAKKQLYLEMRKHGVKSWASPSGTKITMVEETPGTTKKVKEFDTQAFAAENQYLYERYLREVEKTTPGKSGFVRITVPKG